jgi:hypothetical protein
MKEKLMCVLRNRIQDFEANRLTDSLYFEGILFKPTIIQNYEDKVETVVEKSNSFWQKDKTIISTIKVVKDWYWTAEIHFHNKYQFTLTKEEYEEIMEIRRERVEKRQLEKLEELCKNN